MSFANLLDPVEQLSRAAGAEILNVFRGVLDVQEKADQSPVTQADVAAHKMLCAGLDRVLDAPVLSEEGELPSLAERAGWERYWLIDPLDGTRQFIRGSRDFSVNVALIEAGRPILGLILLPAHDLCYGAVSGAGAWRQSEQAGRQAISVVPMQDPLRITVSTERAGPRQAALISHLQPAETLLRGSSWKSCLVAEGVADLYPRFGPTCEWDTAAAQCIVEEAGGAITDLDGQPLRYNTRDSLINPDFWVFGDPQIGHRLAEFRAGFS